MDWLPQLHYPGYNYMGPGTRMKGQKPINWLDEFAKKHDEDYAKIIANSGSWADAYMKGNWADMLVS